MGRAHTPDAHLQIADVQLGARQNRLRVDSVAGYTDLKKRDAELTAHADFRKHLYAYDVVKKAENVGVGATN